MHVSFGCKVAGSKFNPAQTAFDNHGSSRPLDALGPFQYLPSQAGQVFFPVVGSVFACKIRVRLVSNVSVTRSSYSIRLSETFHCLSVLLE